MIIQIRTPFFAMLVLVSLCMTFAAKEHQDVKTLTHKQGIKSVRGGLPPHGRKLKKDDEEEDESGDTPLLVEDHFCEPDPQKAIDYVTYYGHGSLGDQECLADPVNACEGGCCRFSVYFVCDTNSSYPHIACVCNSITKSLPKSKGNP